MDTKQIDFLKESQEIEGFLLQIRSALHSSPELSGEEWATCALIRKTLQEFGIEIQEQFVSPNTVALIRGCHPGPTVALRADIDALPIFEQNDVSYRSRHDGVMHACGHDAHTAMLLGASKLLMQHREQLRGNVKLIFQSSEEKAPGGAKGLVEAGVLENPHVEMIFAQHVQAHFHSGEVGIYTGNFMASSDDFRLTVYGKSCHAAHPQRGIDAILVASQIVVALQSLISRSTMPVIPAVLSVCTISGGEKSNIIAGQVTMTGTLRTLDGTVRQELQEKMRTLSAGIAESMGASCELEFTAGYPGVTNNETAADFMRRSAAKIFGKGHVKVPEYPSTGSEDFAWYQQKCPGVIAHIGCGCPEKGITSAIHTATFDIDPPTLSFGAALLAQTAWDCFAEN